MIRNSRAVWIGAVVSSLLVASCRGAGGKQSSAAPGDVLGSGGSGASNASNNGSGGSTGSSGSGGVHDAGSGGRTSGGAGTAGGAPGNAGAGGRGQAGAAAGSGGQAGSAAPAMSVQFPPPNGQGVCPDPSLRIPFSGPPSFGTTGKIQVWRASQPATAVATIDLGAPTVSEMIGGTTFNLPPPVYVDGNDAVVHLPAHALSYAQTYYVTVDAGTIKGPSGTSMTISDPAAWRFSTVSAAPSELTSLTVALDGSGNFCSVQGALDALPAGNSAASTITINRGTYHEVIHFASKNNVTLRGQDRKATIIAATNNNNLNPSTAGRALIGIDSSKGLIVENLTIHNLTPQGGSQAEALRLQSCEQCVVRDADILSLQDTLLWSGHVYATRCYIEGNVDFIWGTGTAYFDHCEIKTVVRSGYDVQARNSASAYGYVFVDSQLTSDPGVSGSTLARVDVSVYPASHVAYINCQMGSHIAPAGWTITGGAAPSGLRFWEYQSTDPSGNPIDTSQRIAGKQINSMQADMMRDPKMVLGGWQPPN